MVANIETKLSRIYVDIEFAIDLAKEANSGPLTVDEVDHIVHMLSSTFNRLAAAKRNENRLGRQVMKLRNKLGKKQ